MLLLGINSYETLTFIRYLDAEYFINFYYL